MTRYIGSNRQMPSAVEGTLTMIGWVLNALLFLGCVGVGAGFGAIIGISAYAVGAWAWLPWVFVALGAWIGYAIYHLVQVSIDRDVAAQNSTILQSGDWQDQANK